MGPCVRRDDVGREYASAISRRDFARALQIPCPHPRKTGRRESRVPTAPAVSCAKRTVIDAHEHTGSAETARLSPRNGFTAYFVLSPVSGLFCHCHWRDTSRQLSASIAAPGPHDFPVRPRSLVLHARACLKQKRPPHSSPRIVTIAKRPSCGPGWLKI